MPANENDSVMMRLAAVWCLVPFFLGCARPNSELVTVNALGGNVNLSIPTAWSHHQIQQGWAADCNGCSYSEPSDYFGEDSLVQVPITPPKGSFCIVGSNIQPGSFQRSILFRPDVEAELRMIKQKDPSATDEEVIVSTTSKMVEVSYSGRMNKISPIYYFKSVTYFGLNRRVRFSFKGKDSREFRETVAAIHNTIRIKPAFLNEEINK